MNTRATLVGILIFGSFTSAAHADWNYIKWGMTKAEAIAASNGEARWLKPADRYWAGCMFTGKEAFAVIDKKSIGEFEFRVVFCTEGQERVTSVVLITDTRTNPYALLRALVSQYGEPTRVSSDYIWNDAKSGNTITFNAPVSGQIEYKRLGGSGL